MRLYEFEAKKLFSKAGIPIPQGEVVKSPEEARLFTEKLGKPVVLKSQILSGGRGKAGGIKFAQNPLEAKEKASELFSLKIKGFPVEMILVEEKVDQDKEFYLGVTIDRLNYKLVIIACTEGGMEIEEVAKKFPEKVKKLNLDIDEKLYNFQAQTLAKCLGVRGDQIRNVGNIISY
ncbi:MAG: acetate--CoA ligase family protein, partial [candidate division Zixibacteria bacterium]|nr:acetate--CoA ligase family protein [candidate division Zixibacteria bacterium]